MKIDMKYLRRFNEDRGKFAKDEIVEIVDLTLAYVMDDFLITVSDSGKYVVLKEKSGSTFLINTMVDSLYTFVDLIQKKFEIINVISYDNSGNEYAIRDHEDDYKYANKFGTIEKLFEKLFDLEIDALYIVLK